MALDIGTLAVKAAHYKKILANTVSYRKSWHKTLKPLISSTLEEIVEQTEITGKVEIKDNIENLEAIVLDLGRTSSGIRENLEDTDIKRTMVKSNGTLIYQQLFNGKVMIMIISPFIEGYGEPKPPRTIEILRPEELKEGFIIRHVELLLETLTEWEDYDDDEPSSKNAFNPIGFQRIIDED